ncbi:conjugal transfer protein TraO [Flavobacterium sp.]|uniref:conjugal transfer protein TraO n=1 Tax=Flavobacterium sp. TaxID=239 RepID=UPI0040341A78
MKKLIFTSMMFLLVFSGHAQRMLPGQKGLEAIVGTFTSDSPEKNYFLGTVLTIMTKKGNYQLYGVEYAHRYAEYKGTSIPLETFLGEAGYSFRLLADRKKAIAVYAGIAGVGGYETINRGEELLFDRAKILDEEGFVYGAGGRLSLEVYLFDRVVLVLQGRAKMLWGTSLEQFRPSAGAGLRFNL